MSSADSRGPVSARSQRRVRACAGLAGVTLAFCAALPALGDPAEEPGEQAPPAPAEDAAPLPSPPDAPGPAVAPRAAPVLPPAAPEPGPWWRTMQVTVEEVGYHDGFFLEDTEGARDLYLPMPPGVTPQHAELTLDLRFGESLIGESAVRISVDDSVRRTVRRADAGGGGVLNVSLPLAGSDLARTFVKVHFDYTQLMDRDVCFSRNVAGAYTRIAPGSGLSILVGDAPPATVRATWSLLPRTVVISADLGAVTASDLQALFALATLLRREGHGYRFEHVAPTAALEAVHGQIVLADAAELKRWGATTGRANLQLVVSGSGAPKRVFLAIDRARPQPAVELLRMPWRRAAAARHIDVAQAAEWPPAPDHPGRVSLRELGFIDAERRFSSLTEWKFDLPNGPMGDGMRPDQVELTVFAPSVHEDRTPVILSAYFNERLVFSSALKGRGDAQVLSFALPATLLRARNRLNLVAQRDEVASNCRVTVAAQPISISPDSTVLLAPAPAAPGRFAELVAFQRSLQVYVAADALNDVAESVPALVALGEYFWPDVPAPALQLFEPGTPLAPHGPFLVVGNPAWQPDAPIAFDRGRVRIANRGAQGKPAVLDLGADADASSLQMVRAGEAAGAWLRVPAGYASLPTEGLQFEDENVALLDRQGVQLALRIGPTAEYTVSYPDAVGWFESHRRLRVALFVAAWLAAAFVGVALIRRARSTGDRDDEP